MPKLLQKNKNRPPRLCIWLYSEINTRKTGKKARITAQKTRKPFEFRAPFSFNSSLFPSITSTFAVSHLKHLKYYITSRQVFQHGARLPISCRGEIIVRLCASVYRILFTCAGSKNKAKSGYSQGETPGHYLPRPS
jgi:hypothetical protein